jgi:hypothetical protein
MSIKIAVNKCYGGFTLSQAAENRLRELGMEGSAYGHDIARDNPLLIQVIEELGDAASGRFSKLAITEIPDDVAGNWQIGEYDGTEWVEEKHRTW